MTYFQIFSTENGKETLVCEWQSAAEALNAFEAAARVPFHGLLITADGREIGHKKLRLWARSELGNH